MKNKSHINMLNKRGPKIDPWGTPNKTNYLTGSEYSPDFWIFKPINSYKIKKDHTQYYPPAMQGFEKVLLHFKSHIFHSTSSMTDTFFCVLTVASIHVVLINAATNIGGQIFTCFISFFRIVKSKTFKEWWNITTGLPHLKTPKFSLKRSYLCRFLLKSQNYLKLRL